MFYASKILLSVALFLLLLPMAQAKKEIKTLVNCSDINAVAKEAVAYFLTGAPSTNLPLDCAKKMKWKYFDPNREEHTPEGNSPKPDYTWFDPKKDSYEVLSTTQRDNSYDIKVVLNVGGKKINTTYIYDPNKFFQENYGVCGFIYNRNKPYVFRKDCR